jgi:hypothetical protein
MMITNVRLTPAMKKLAVVLTALIVMIKICAREIVVILITVVNMTKFLAKITMNVQSTFVLVIKVAYIMILSAMMMMSVPSILAVKKMDVNLHLPVVTIITNARMILAILLLDV